MKTNYQKVMDIILRGIADTGETPSLLLHSCCGPCSSYVLEYLSEFFNITVLYYNPNIWPSEEFYKRADTQRQLVSSLPTKNPVRLVVPDYRPEEFNAAEHGFNWFTTTLSVSPHKDAEALNTIGGELEEKYGVKYLYADFKKRNGYKRSIELSKEYGLYRQDYCGCRYSLPSGRGD
jgi:predicted adenine nucleotide alpha hydrolase (AANH) superfamily ATPase